MKAGTVVSCPDCGAEQMKSTKDLLPGSQMREAEWESLGFDLNGERGGCHECGTKFIRTHPKTGKTQLHTKDELWVSLTKELPT